MPQSQGGGYSVTTRSMIYIHWLSFRGSSPLQRKTDIDDWELLGVKLTLEEWRHQLEGTVHPFTLFTDHKNLVYLYTA